MTEPTELELEDQINQMSEEQDPEIAQFEAEVAAEEKKRVIKRLLTLQNDISVERFGVPLQHHDKLTLYGKYRDLPIAQLEEEELKVVEKERVIYRLLTLQNDISVAKFGVPLQEHGTLMLYGKYRDLPIKALNKISRGTEEQLQELLHPTVPPKKSMCNRFGCWFSSLFGKSGKNSGKKQKRNGKKSKRGLRKAVSKKRLSTKTRTKNCSVTKK